MISTFFRILRFLWLVLRWPALMIAAVIVVPYGFGRLGDGFVKWPYAAAPSFRAVWLHELFWVGVVLLFAMYAVMFWQLFNCENTLLPWIREQWEKAKP